MVIKGDTRQWLMWRLCAHIKFRVQGLVSSVLQREGGVSTAMQLLQTRQDLVLIATVDGGNLAPP